MENIEYAVYSLPMSLQTNTSQESLEPTTEHEGEELSPRQYINKHITLQRLILEIRRVLLEQGDDPEAWRRWTTTALIQTRISKPEAADPMGSDSPERQLIDMAYFCVQHQLRPKDVWVEYVSAHTLFGRGSRPKMEAWFDKIKSGEYRVDCIVTVHADRFTRNPPEMSQWTIMLIEKGIELYALNHYDEEGNYCV